MEWRFYYLDYDLLKRVIKERTTGKEFTEYDEASFVETFDKEIQKVINFKELKGGELERRIQHYEGALNGMDLKKLSEKALAQFHTELEKITQELGQLGRFCRLNYTSMLKILKKHDKHTKLLLRPTYLVRFNAHPIYFETLDGMIYRLSKLYNILATKGECLESPLSPQVRNNGGGIDAAQNFVRRTTKYWVHPDNVTDLKITIMKNLPVLVYQSKKDNFDQAISSVYLDNDNMELYTGRIEKTEGAQAVRIRWYGSEDPNEVFIERKIHREDWTGEISVKSRFALKEKYVDSFLSGKHTLEKTIAKLKSAGRKSEEDLETLRTLGKEIQETVAEKKLKPFLRTFYNRTAFQLPGDASVRISLDTELSMIKEEGYIKDGHWKRRDVACNYPFQGLASDEIVRFPYAILEVKLQTQSGQDPPKWVTQLTQGPLVEEVPKFSKFVHGCAVLFEKNVSLFPFWLPQMNVDIRKNITPTISISSSHQSAITSPAHNLQGDNISDIIVASKARYSKDVDALSLPPSSIKNSSNLKDVVIDIYGQGAGRDNNESLPIDDERHPLLGSTQKISHTLTEEPQALVPSGVSRSRRGFATLKNFFKKRRSAPDSILTSQARTANSSKRIAIPVRVEPKVFFANERTFLSWLHFSIFLGGIATALVGLGDRPAKISGYVFAGVSVLFAFYALYLYQWRARKIRQRDPGPYDDLFGPTMLVIVFLAAMSINFVFSGIISSTP